MASVNCQASTVILQQESLSTPSNRRRSRGLSYCRFIKKHKRYYCGSVRDTNEALAESSTEPTSPSHEDKRHDKLEGEGSAPFRKREIFPVIKSIDTIKDPCLAFKNDSITEGTVSRTLANYRCSPSAAAHTGVADANISVNIDGFLITLIAIVSGIVGRVSSQELRYDATRLYRLQESLRAISMELRKKREVWKAQEDIRMLDLQKQRVQRAREKASLEAERQRKLQEKFELV